MATRIEIDTQDGNSWLYDKYDTWKEYVGVADFDETFVLKGNRDYKDHTDASWYTKVTELLNDIDCYYDLDTKEGIKDLMDEHNLSDNQYTEIKQLYDKCRCTEDIICAVLNIIYPDTEYKESTIRGYNQGDWQNVLYDTSKANDKDIEMLEAIYFGQINEVSYGDEESGYCSTFITDNELWKREREGTIEKYVREVFQIDKDEDIEIFISDGYIRTTKWKQIK